MIEHPRECQGTWVVIGFNPVMEGGIFGRIRADCIIIYILFHTDI